MKYFLTDNWERCLLGFGLFFDASLEGCRKVAGGITPGTRTRMAAPRQGVLERPGPRKLFSRTLPGCSLVFMENRGCYPRLLSGQPSGLALKYIIETLLKKPCVPHSETYAD